MIEQDEKNLEDPHDDQQEESRILEKETKKADEWPWLSPEAKVFKRDGWTNLYLIQDCVSSTWIKQCV